MSIKQQGGVFGRNPTFNDVTIEGQLTFDGDIDINSDLKVSGAVEATTLYASTSIAVGNPANYQATFYMPGANANYVQVVNGMTGAGPINGILYGLDASGNGVLNKQGNGDLITTVAGVERLRILEAGTFDVSAANIAFDSGYGIDFSATSGTGTSELFDDYEEGTWTPQLTNATGPTTPYTMSNIVTPRYTKIGRLVHVECWVQTTNVNTAGASGALRIAGLPFTAGSSSFAAAGVTYIATWAGDSPSSGIVEGGSTLITLRTRSASNGADAAMDAADLTSGAGAANVIALTVSYTV